RGALRGARPEGQQDAERGRKGTSRAEQAGYGDQVRTRRTADGGDGHEPEKIRIPFDAFAVVEGESAPFEETLGVAKGDERVVEEECAVGRGHVQDECARRHERDERGPGAEASSRPTEKGGSRSRYHL